MNIYTTDHKKNKQVLCGKLELGVFTRHAKASHFSYKYNGYGIQEDVFSRLLKSNTTEIVIVQDTKRFSSPISHWIEFGICDDLGHGVQRFLSIRYMNVSDSRQTILF